MSFFFLGLPWYSLTLVICPSSFLLPQLHFLIKFYSDQMKISFIQSISFSFINKKKVIPLPQSKLKNQNNKRLIFLPLVYISFFSFLFFFYNVYLFFFVQFIKRNFLSLPKHAYGKWISFKLLLEIYFLNKGKAFHESEIPKW
jgi:hypothetical protein